MIDVAARQGGQGYFLTKAGNGPLVPAGKAKGAACVLPRCAPDQQRVGLHLDDATQHRVGQAQPVVDLWQSNWLQPLPVAGAQCLRRPAGKGEIGIGINTLDRRKSNATGRRG